MCERVQVVWHWFCARELECPHPFSRCALQAVRARCSVGEISSALEEVYGRFTPENHLVSGAYTEGYEAKEDVEESMKVIDEFAERNGRRPRILVAKIGQDGHDRGQKVIATGFADMGYGMSPKVVERHSCVTVSCYHGR